MKLLISACTVLMAASLPAGAGNCPDVVTKSAAQSHVGNKGLACRENHGGRTTVYELEGRNSDGGRLALEIDPAGVILSTKEEMPIHSLPEAVTTAILSAHPAAKLTAADRVRANTGDITFAVQFTSGGRKKDLEFMLDGTVVRRPKERDY